jgi:hypothetical protein
MNSEMIWKIWKKGKLKRGKIWKIWKKSKQNSDMIWKIWKKSKLNYFIFPYLKKNKNKNKKKKKKNRSKKKKKKRTWTWSTTQHIRKHPKKGREPPNFWLRMCAPMGTPFGVT